jgi:hypothetical protein
MQNAERNTTVQPPSVAASAFAVCGRGPPSFLGSLSYLRSNHSHSSLSHQLSLSLSPPASLPVSPRDNMAPAVASPPSLSLRPLWCTRRACQPSSLSCQIKAGGARWPPIVARLSPPAAPDVSCSPCGGGKLQPQSPPPHLGDPVASFPGDPAAYFHLQEQRPRGRAAAGPGGMWTATRASIWLALTANGASIWRRSGKRRRSDGFDSVGDEASSAHSLAMWPRNGPRREAEEVHGARRSRGQHCPSFLRLREQRRAGCVVGAPLPRSSLFSSPSAFFSCSSGAGRTLVLCSGAPRFLRLATGANCRDGMHEVMRDLAGAAPLLQRGRLLSHVCITTLCRCRSSQLLESVLSCNRIGCSWFSCSYTKHLNNLYHQSFAVQHTSLLLSTRSSGHATRPLLSYLFDFCKLVCYQLISQKLLHIKTSNKLVYKDQIYTLLPWFIYQYMNLIAHIDNLVEIFKVFRDNNRLHCTTPRTRMVLWLAMH